MLSVAGDVNCSHLAANRPKMYEQLARALSDFYETAKGLFVCGVNLFQILDRWWHAVEHSNKWTHKTMNILQHKNNAVSYHFTSVLEQQLPKQTSDVRNCIKELFLVLKINIKWGYL